MDIYDVCIPTFINPHLFWFVDVKSKQRTEILENIDKYCKNHCFSISTEPFKIGEYVIIKKSKTYYRAIIQEVYGEDELSPNGYSCWLMDYAKMNVVTDVYSMPEELQNIPPLARQASLHNITYNVHQLEFGIKSKTRIFSSITPSAVVSQSSIECLTNATAIHFKILHDDDILFGDVIIKRKSKSISLTKYLVDQGLVNIDEEGFKKLKNSIDTYKRTHLLKIHEISAQQKGFGGKHPTFNLSDVYRDFEETDAYHIPPMLTGRRKNLNASTTSESSSNSNCEENGKPKLSKLQILREKLNLLRHQDEEEQAEEEKMNLELENKENKKLNARQKARQFLMQTRQEEEGDTESETNENDLSDFYSPNNSKNSNGNDEEKPSVVGFKDILKDEPACPIPSNVIFGPTTKVICDISKSNCSKSIHKHKKSKHSRNKQHIKPVQSDDNKVEVKKTDTSPAEESSSDSKESRPVFDPIKHNLGCQCKNCYIWNAEDDWENDIHFDEPKIDKKPKADVKRPSLLLWNKDEEVPQKHISSVDYKDMSRVQKMAAPKLIVHGETIPGPVHEIKRVQFHQNIQNTLNHLEYRESKKIQTYSWTALFRGQHVFMVGDPKSGKTVSYLPVLCSFILEKGDRYKPLLKMGGGPIILILCNSSKKCEDVHDLMRVLFGNNRIKLSLITYPCERINTSNIDILVTMPTILAALLLSRAVNFRRLCHIVLEDGDSLLKSHSSLVAKFLNLTQEMLAHRSCDKTVQLVVCSERWNSQAEALAKKLRRAPLVLISNYIEAAMYGKVGFVLKMLDSTRKELELKNLLENCFKFEKSLILCRDDDVNEVSNMLMVRGIEYLEVKEDMDVEDIICLEEIWNTSKSGEFSVLICSDTVFNTVLNVTSVDLLIHYNLPNTWSQFMRRFSSFLENCKSPFDSKERKIKSRSVVFIDETCEKTMVKFLSLLGSSEQKLPKNIASYLEGLKLKQETEKIQKDVEICDNLKLFGKCDELRCSYRHKINKTLDEINYLPKNGVLTFKIIDILDVSSFKIEVSEHIDFDNNTTQIVNKSEEINNNLTTIKRERVKIPCIGHVYMYHEEDVFCRCKIISHNKNNVTVSLIDKDRSHIVTPIRNLYKLPLDYKNLCPQTNIATVYLANLIPPHKDETFSTKSYRLLEETLQTIFYKDAVFRGQIMLCLDHCFWLKNVEEVREMFDKDLPTSGFQLSRELKVRKFAETDETQLQNLYKLCVEAELELPSYEPPKKVVKKKPQPKPQWAFLEANKINEVIFSAAVSPEEFTVRLAKFDKQLSNLENEISVALRKPFFPEIGNIIENNCYLAKEIEGEQYCRVLVRRLENDKCICFFVDYGEETVLQTSQLKHLPDKFITLLPFQAIQCRLRGVKPIYDLWSFSDSDILYEYALEPNSDIFRSLYVKVCDKESNMLIPAQKRYSVLLKDGFGEKKVLINRLMIDCGVAMENHEVLEDFEIPETKNNASDIDEDIETLDVRKDKATPEEKEEVVFMDGFEVTKVDEMGEMELNVADPKKFLEDLMSMVENKEEKPQKKRKNEEKKAPKNELPEIKALPPVEYSTPTVYWSQTEDSVKLKIDLADAKDYKVAVVRNRMFNFSCDKAGKPYKLKLMLFDTVDRTFQHTAVGPHVRVALKKARPGAEWPRLVVAADRLRHVRYDVSTINVEEEEERRCLDLNISDSDGESDENDVMYTVVSDIDSDYDYDIPDDRDML